MRLRVEGQENLYSAGKEGHRRAAASAEPRPRKRGRSQLRAIPHALRFGHAAPARRAALWPRSTSVAALRRRFGSGPTPSQRTLLLHRRFSPRLPSPLAAPSKVSPQRSRLPLSADARSADLPSICGLSMSADVLPLLADSPSAGLLPVGAPLGSQVVLFVDLPAARVCYVPTTAPPLGRRCRCHGTCGLVTHIWAPDVCVCSSRLRH